MGPTTAALLQFFLADQAYVDARHKLEAATKNVRLQLDKVTQTQSEHDAAHASATALEAKAREVEGDMKAREARIEFLRDRQTNATNPKEYQALLVEISTQKLDKGKLEEQALGHIEKADAEKTKVAGLKANLDTETAKHTTMSGAIDGRVKELTGQVEALKGPRDELAAKLPIGAKHAYERAADRYDGEAMAPIEKPDPRDQEYLCTGCNTYLVVDVYNRLRSSKDEIVVCPSCLRVLFIPEDLTPELALSKKAARGDLKPPKVKGEKKPRAARAKKEKAGPIEPGSVAEAAAAGAASSRGKGPKDKTKPLAAPLPTTHAGVVESPELPVNVETENAPDAAATLDEAGPSDAPVEEPSEASHS